jgi:hypothetical protein
MYDESVRFSGSLPELVGVVGLGGGTAAVGVGAVLVVLALGVAAVAAGEAMGVFGAGGVTVVVTWFGGAACGAEMGLDVVAGTLWQPQLRSLGAQAIGVVVCAGLVRVDETQAGHIDSRANSSTKVREKRDLMVFVSFF